MHRTANREEKTFSLTYFLGTLHLMCPKNGGQYSFFHRSPLEGVFIEYTRDIRWVFMGYTYVSGMCRVCVGYVSGKHRKILGAERGPGTRKEGKISPTDGTD